MLGLNRVDIGQGTGVLRPVHVLKIVKGSQLVVGGVELGVGAIHPEHVRQLVAFSLGAQLGEVVLESGQGQGHLNVGVLFVEGLNPSLDRGGLVLVPVS